MDHTKFLICSLSIQFLSFADSRLRHYIAATAAENTRILVMTMLHDCQLVSHCRFSRNTSQDSVSQILQENRYSALQAWSLKPSNLSIKSKVIESETLRLRHTINYCHERMIKSVKKYRASSQLSEKIKEPVLKKR